MKCFHILLTLTTLLAFVLCDAPSNTLSKRAIITAYDGNPGFVRVFQNPDPNQHLIAKFLSNTNHNEYEVNQNGDYIFHFPLRDYDDDEYEDDDDEFDERPQEMPDGLWEKVQNQEQIPDRYYNKPYKFDEGDHKNEYNNDNEDDEHIEDKMESDEYNSIPMFNKNIDDNSETGTSIVASTTTVMPSETGPTVFLSKLETTTTTTTEKPPKLFVSKINPESPVPGKLYVSNATVAQKEVPLTTNIQSNANKITPLINRKPRPQLTGFSKFLKDVFGFTIYPSRSHDEDPSSLPTREFKIHNKKLTFNDEILRDRINEILPVPTMKPTKKISSVSYEDLPKATFLPKNTHRMPKKQVPSYRPFPEPNRLGSTRGPLENITAWYILNSLGLDRIRRSLSSAEAEDLSGLPEPFRNLFSKERGLVN